MGVPAFDTQEMQACATHPDRVFALATKAIKLLDSLYPSSHVVVPQDRPIVFIGDVQAEADILRPLLRKYLTEGYRVVQTGDYLNASGHHHGDERIRTSNIETLMLQYQALDQYGSQYVPLRGNQEDEETYSSAGGLLFQLLFKKMVRETPLVEKALAALPLSASGNGWLAMHGGLPDFPAAGLYTAPKGISNTHENILVRQMLWNDSVWPDFKGDIGEKGIAENQYRRDRRNPDAPNFVKVYGDPFFTNKMAEYGKNVLIRGHGAHAKGLTFDDRILTIMTNRQNANDGIRKGAYVAILDDPTKEVKSGRDLRLVDV